MNKEQVKELAEINATYTFDRVTKQYGEFTDEYVRHFYNKLAELRCGIDDVHTCNYQHNCNSRDSEFRQTNADSIRNMSDEELAMFIGNLVECANCDLQCSGTGIDECCRKHLEWLQSEAE